MLTTENLEIGYPKAPALLAPISAQVPLHRLTVLLGANGAGKSSLLRTLAGLQRSRAGKVSWAGKDISDFSVQDLAQTVSLVLTYRPQDSYMTVEEVVALGRFPYMRWHQGRQKEDTQIIETALACTQATHLRHKRLATLSDGQFQKVMIARALAQDTPVILLDEPTAHLDLAHRFLIFELLRALAHTAQKTILVATHDLEPALQTADKVWLLHNQQCHIALPESLAWEGTLARAFGSERLVYDTQNDTFRLTQTPLACLQLTCLPEATEALHATQKALQRIGFEVVDSAPLQIRLLPAPAGYCWEWVGKGQYNDLETFINTLQTWRIPIYPSPHCSKFVFSN